MHDKNIEKSRKGSRTMAEVSPELRRRLERAEEESITLVEWLVVDQKRLAKNILPDAGFEEDEVKTILRRYDEQRPEGIMAKLHAMATSLLESLQRHKGPERKRLYENIARHPSCDIAREWAALSISLDTGMKPAARWKAIRPFAADGNMNVREIAWLSLRPWVIADHAEAIRLYTPWVTDRHEGIRRCAIEGTRPRGVWCNHFPALKVDPSPALPLLEAVKSDPSRYVQNAVGNWLNDASKDNEEWVRQVTTRWLKESPTKETAYIVKRGMRTLNKKR